MAVRSTMANLILKIRLLINDTSGTPTFTDQAIQDVMDASRQDVRYLALTPAPTYSGSTISYLDYYADFTDWEDDVTFWQYRTIQVTPATSENIAAHWTFSLTTLPPVYLLGKTYDCYRSAADLLERQAAQWSLSYDVAVDGQSLHRSQATTALQTLAHTYRLQQRMAVITTTRSDLMSGAGHGNPLGPREIDYY